MTKEERTGGAPIQTSLVRRTLGPRSLPRKHGLRKVVVLGAGAAKSFGLPLANELLPGILNWHRAQGRDAALEEIFAFIEYFYPSFRRDGAAFPPAEDVLGMMEVALDYNRIRSRTSVGNRWRDGRVKAIRAAFQRLLGQYLWSFQNNIRVAEFSYFRDFVRRNGVCVIYVTFNYDLLLESALSAEGIPFCYDLRFPTDGVSVLKPHGSINWFSVTKKFSASVETFELWDHEVQRGSPGQNPSEGIQVCTTLDPNVFDAGKWKEPLIIPPTPMKQIESQDLKRIWASFSSAIHAAKRVEIIGYSLPAADRLARLVLRKAGPPHHQHRPITVVNPADVEQTFRDAISPNCAFVRVCFNDWVAQGCGEAIQSQQPASRVPSATTTVTATTMPG